MTLPRRPKLCRFCGGWNDCDYCDEKNLEHRRPRFQAPARRVRQPERPRQPVARAVDAGQWSGAREDRTTVCE